ncbi:MAG: hypothetical protein K6E98_04605, partial [Lachnospiraceae bacterium]|nr:hypothetical protein [Lachnospiraceae bacterium]
MNNWNIGGGFNAVSANSDNGIVLYSYEALFICAVDAFVMITGFFMHSRLSIDFFKIILLI